MTTFRPYSQEALIVGILLLSRWRPTASNPTAEESMCRLLGARAGCPTTPTRTRRRPTWLPLARSRKRLEARSAVRSSRLLSHRVLCPVHRVGDPDLPNELAEEHPESRSARARCVPEDCRVRGPG